MITSIIGRPKEFDHVKVMKLRKNNIRNRVNYKRFDEFNKFLIDNDIDSYIRINILTKLHETIDDLVGYPTFELFNNAKECLNLLIDDINSE